jgi:hypothetical protein
LSGRVNFRWRRIAAGQIVETTEDVPDIVLDVTLLSEAALARDWDIPEEDDAWQGRSIGSGTCSTALPTGMLNRDPREGSGTR